MTTAVTQMIERATGVRVGLGEPPRVTDAEAAAGMEAPALPYVILYPLMGGEFSGPAYLDYEADSCFLYQTTVVAANGQQAEWWADRVREVMIGRGRDGSYLHHLPAVGFGVMERRSEGSAGGMDTSGNLCSVPERFFIDVTADTADMVRGGVGGYDGGY